MTTRITQDDLDLMMALAEHRVLTKGQIARLFARNERALRDRLSTLSKESYVQVQRISASKRGRPESQTYLTVQGVNLLKDRGILPDDIGAKRTVPDQLTWSMHHRALNDIRVELAILPKLLPTLKVAFLTDTSPMLRTTRAGQIFVADWLDRADGGGDSQHLIPDGAFMIRHETRNTALLFFLEIDMGTETLASQKGERTDVRHKLDAYQDYFRSGKSSRYGEAWQCRFRGFRVLFVTHPAGRRDAICRLVTTRAPLDFIWVADHDQLVSQGLAAPVWCRGGRMDSPETSILGSEVSQEILAKTSKPQR